jgi:hypothetical protein
MYINVNTYGKNIIDHVLSMYTKILDDKECKIVNKYKIINIYFFDILWFQISNIGYKI